MTIKEYFKDTEISCKCGCGMLPDARSVELLYALRIALGRPLVITSAARCELRNKSVGGATNSAHMTGNAFDIRTANGAEAGDIVRAALAVGFVGVGISNKGFVHVDNSAARGGKITVWQYA